MLKEKDGPDFLFIISLFEGQFSVDWILELTGIKTSEMLKRLDLLTKKGVLSNNEAGFYSFKDEGNRVNFHKDIERGEKESYLRRIVEIIKNDESIINDKEILLSKYLLKVPVAFPDCQILIKAGDIYREIRENNKALECYKKALLALYKLEGPEYDRAFINTVHKLSRYSLRNESANEISRFIKEAIRRIEKSSDFEKYPILEMHLAKIEWVNANYHEAWSHFEKGWAFANKTNRPPSVSIHLFRIFYFYWKGLFKDLVEYYQSNLSTVLDHSVYNMAVIAVKLLVGTSLSHIGRVEDGLSMLLSGYDLSIQNNDMHLAAEADVDIGSLLLNAGDFHAAVEYLKKAYTESENANNLWSGLRSSLLLSVAYLFLRKNSRARMYVRNYFSFADRVGLATQLSPWIFELCWAAEQGILSNTPELKLSREIEKGFKSQNVLMRGVAYRYKALLLRSHNADSRQILKNLDYSLKNLHACGDVWELFKTNIERVRQYHLMGNDDKAREIIAGAVESQNASIIESVPDDLRQLLNEKNLESGILASFIRTISNGEQIDDAEKMLNHALSSAVMFSGFERGVIFIIKKRFPKLELEPVALANITESQIHHQSLSYIFEAAEQTIAAGKELTKQSGGPNAGIAHTHVCLPLFFQKELLGIFYLENRFKRRAPDHLSGSIVRSLCALSSLFVWHLKSARVKTADHDATRLKLNGDAGTEATDRLIEDIIGKTGAIEGVIDQINKISRTDSSVLVLGETGVGKEVVAAAIHKTSKRRDKPFIAVQCCALPENLILSELFGHEKGAFTGATNRHIGRFELADGGTLFLDEIGDMTKEVQIRLLRFLETRKFERIGGKATLSSDFRLICATNRDLEADVASGVFRADLYFRINVFPLHVPPLRERKEDIYLLAKYFLENFNRIYGREPMEIPDPVVRKLMDYDWPGNVRELKNVIERAITLSKTKMLELPTDFMVSNYIVKNTDDFLATLKENEARHIIRTLEKTDWKVRGSNGAAEILGIPASTLFFKMKKHGIRRPNTNR